MRFHHKKYQEGDTRIRRKFLLFPKTLKTHSGKTITRWWEYVTYLEQYTHEQALLGDDYFWVALRWLDID